MSERLSEYFTRDAADYLAQLAQLLAQPDGLDPERMMQLARGVRGSAQMAGAETIAAVAERLEDAARSVLSRNIVWSDEIRLLAADTVSDLQLLVRAVNRWGPEEEARVRAAIERWDDLEGPEGAARRGARVIPVSDLFYDDAGPHILSTAPEREAAEPAVVPVERLVFRGESALREALRLRPEVERLAQSAGATELDERLREVFDLIELGLPAGTAPR
jgi:HPt (histidine-containing phosphotransfer) domain-containing protein